MIRGGGGYLAVDKNEHFCADLALLHDECALLSSQRLDCLRKPVCAVHFSN